MKKTLKLVLIFVGGLVAIIVSSLTGYFIISKNKTFYIYDVRLVEPNSGMKGYIYTDSEAEYTSIKNQVVYMRNQKSNLYPIAVYASSSSNTKDVVITSSDPSVAKIVYKDNACFVQYLKEGFVTITSELHGVKDSFNIQIHDQLPSGFTVFDYEYYGDYAEVFRNKIVSYADGMEYRFGFFLNNASQTGDNATIDSDLIEIDDGTFLMDTFESVTIDSETSELVVKCKVPSVAQTDDIDDTIVIQSFYYDENGEKVEGRTYNIDVHVVLYIPEFLQIEVSSTPDFDEGVVYTNTKKTEFSYTKEEIEADEDLKTALSQHLSAEKAENFLSKKEEKATYNAFFTDRVKSLYLRPRMVYSNGDVVYLKHGVNAAISYGGRNDLCYLDPTESYYILSLNTDNYFIGDVSSFTINVSLNSYGFNFSHSFVFEFKTLDNVSDFYKYDSEAKVYTYVYWDDRARFGNAIYDKNGNVIGFGA